MVIFLFGARMVGSLIAVTRLHATVRAVWPVGRT